MPCRCAGMLSAVPQAGNYSPPKIDSVLASSEKKYSVSTAVIFAPNAQPATSLTFGASQISAFQASSARSPANKRQPVRLSLTAHPSPFAVFPRWTQDPDLAPHRQWQETRQGRTKTRSSRCSRQQANRFPFTRQLYFFV